RARRGPRPSSCIRSTAARAGPNRPCSLRPPSPTARREPDVQSARRPDEPARGPPLRVRGLPLLTRGDRGGTPLGVPAPPRGLLGGGLHPRRGVPVRRV